jgi:hypothetical protein
MKDLEILGWNANHSYIDWKLNGKAGNSAIRDSRATDAHLCGSPSYHNLLTRDTVEAIMEEVTNWFSCVEGEQAPLYIFQLSSYSTRYVKSAAVIAHTAEEAQELLLQTHPEFSDIWAKATITEIAPLGVTGPFDPVVLSVEQW